MQTRSIDVEKKTVKDNFTFIRKDIVDLANVEKICLYEGAIKAFGFNAGRSMWSPGCPDCTKTDIQVVEYLSKLSLGNKSYASVEDVVLNINNSECGR